MIEKNTRKLFKAWLAIPAGGAHVGRVPDSYATYANQCQAINLDVFNNGSLEILDLQSLDALLQAVDYRRLTLTHAQISPNARLNNVKAGLSAFRGFLTWLLENPLARTFGQIMALIAASVSCNVSKSSGEGFQQKNTSKKGKQKSTASATSSAEMIDSYQLLFDYFACRPFTPANFYKFGLEKSVYADRISIQSVELQFQLLINLLETGGFGDVDPQGRQKAELHIRKYSGSKTKSRLYIELYKMVFPKAKIVVEDGGNATPKANLRRVTKCLPYSRSDSFHVSSDIQIVLKNFQCSHILDNRTKNPLLFEAVWNMAFTPKVIDPLTGHETLGRWPSEFQPRFRNEDRRRFSFLMKKFNVFADKYRQAIHAAAEKVATAHEELTVSEKQKFIADALEQWEPVEFELEHETDAFP